MGVIVELRTRESASQNNGTNWRGPESSPPTSFVRVPRDMRYTRVLTLATGIIVGQPMTLGVEKCDRSPSLMTTSSRNLVRTFPGLWAANYTLSTAIVLLTERIKILDWHTICKWKHRAKITAGRSSGVDFLTNVHVTVKLFMLLTLAEWKMFSFENVSVQRIIASCVSHKFIIYRRGWTYQGKWISDVTSRIYHVRLWSRRASVFHRDPSESAKSWKVPEIILEGNRKSCGDALSFGKRKKLHNICDKISVNNQVQLWNRHEHSKDSIALTR